MASRMENLSSQLDGVTTVFTLSRSYIQGSLMVIVNGLFFTPLVDFVMSSPTSFQLTSNVVAPESGEVMWVLYEPVVPPAVTGSGGSPGDYRVMGLPDGSQVRIFY